MYKVGDAVVVSDPSTAGREGEVDFITLKDGIYWWRGIITDTDVKIEGITKPLIGVQFGKHDGNFYTGQVHTEADAMDRINRKDIFQQLAEQRTPTEKRVARYTFDMDVDKMRERLESLQRRINFAMLTESRNVELVQEYNALLDVYRRRTRQGI